MINLEKRLARLEHAAIKSDNFHPHRVPGTFLTRILASRDWWISQKVRIHDDGRDSVNGWCLSLGGHLQPKQHFNDLSIEYCIRKAEKFIKENKHVK